MVLPPGALDPQCVNWCFLQGAFLQLDNWEHRNSIILWYLMLLKGAESDGVLWVVHFSPEKLFLRSWEPFSGAVNSPAESDTSKRRCLFILCLAYTRNWPVPELCGCRKSPVGDVDDESKPCQGCWEDQICVWSALGDPTAGWPCSLGWGWLLWDLQEQRQVLTRRWEAPGVEVEVDLH